MFWSLILSKRALTLAQRYSRPDSFILTVLYSFTLMTLNVATATKLDLLVADIQGEITYTVLPTRKARKSELIMSRTQGPRTNTNRRGQAYNGHATHAQNAVIEGNAAAYFKTSG